MVGSPLPYLFWQNLEKRRVRFGSLAAGEAWFEADWDERR
jgi:hypothetical protein